MDYQPHKSPTWHRARMHAIEELVEVLEAQMERAGTEKKFRQVEMEHLRLRKGMVPARYRATWDRRIERSFKKHFPTEYRQWKAGKPFEEKPLTFEELTSFNTFFRLNPDRILGQEIANSGRAFPILIDGTIEQATQKMEKALTAMNAPVINCKPIAENSTNSNELKQLLDQLQDFEL